MKKENHRKDIVNPRGRGDIAARNGLRLMEYGTTNGSRKTKRAAQSYADYRWSSIPADAGISQLETVYG